uniref:Transcriptional regulator n=1 Tax=Panagrellus redivivus TaxID=6233 RepID=A0A7E4W797_PANRE
MYFTLPPFMLDSNQLSPRDISQLTAMAWPTLTELVGGSGHIRLGMPFRFGWKKVCCTCKFRGIGVSEICRA